MTPTESAALDGAEQVVRSWSTGATRDLDVDKIDYVRLLDPFVEEIYGNYMKRNRQTAAGMRDWDNWKAGMPRLVCLSSLDRHVRAVREIFQNWDDQGYNFEDEGVAVEHLCGVLFNAMVLIREIRLGRDIEAATSEE